jgi:hypothetical protein
MPQPRHALPAFLTRQVDFNELGTYSGEVSATGSYFRALPSFYAPSHKYRRLAFGSYGFGHTTRREPGDLRGTVIGKKGRYRILHARGGDA